MRLASAALVALMLSAAPAHAQTAPPAAELVDRAAEYVKRFVSGFSNVVAEEDFRQDWQSGERRRLTSDFLLVQYPGTVRTWLAFRDVTAINGRPVRDQQERLTKLFLEPFADAVRRAEEITREASRHSLVPLTGLDSPFVVLAWLQPVYHSQFIYRTGNPETKAGIRVRRLELEEIVPPAANAALGRVVPSRSTAWIDEATGRVVSTETRYGPAPNATIVTTTFRFDEGLGIDVPAEMRQSRVGPPGAGAASRRTTLGPNVDRFTGVATYSRFRRFGVRTEEEIDTPAATPR